MKKQAVAVIRWRSTRGPEYETAEKAKEISTYLSSISGRLRHAAQARLQMGFFSVSCFAFTLLEVCDSADISRAWFGRWTGKAQSSLNLTRFLNV
jgi:hypothetical protein